MSYAFWSGGQSNMVRLEDDLEALLKAHYGLDTLLIRSAVNGSGISEWQRNGLYYENAVADCHEATMQGYTIKMGIWCQGERETVTAELAATWGPLYGTFLNDFRSDILSIGIPFVHSVLGRTPIEGIARPAWIAVQKQQVNALYGKPVVDRVDLMPYGPYAPGDGGVHYDESPNGYPAIAQGFMRIITGRIPQA